MNNSNNASARESYDIAKRMFYRAFRPNFPPGPSGDQACDELVNSFKLSQSELRFEVELNANNNNFLFGVTNNQPNTQNQQFPTEQRLNLQDSFCVNEHALLVAFPSSRTSTIFPVLAYANPFIFTGAGVADEINNRLYCNGSLQWKVNNDVLVPYRGTLNHWYKPQTQQTAAVGAGSPLDQFRGAEDGSITDEPNLVLIGSKNSQIYLNLPAAMSTGTFTFERAILICRGVLAQNSTVVS